jgi:glycosyltransferase involved in cell wall biosynthesis
MTQSSLPTASTEPVLVSVVLPAYNHEAYIAQAIDSALAQSVDLELIVIDDGSRDRTADIISAYDDPRIRFVRQANAGSHATINRGIAMARGRYVAILNSDDRFHPERLARLVALARSRTGPTFAVTGIRLIDAAGKPITDPEHPWLRMHAQIRDAWRRDPQPQAALLWGNFSISTSNLFADRELFREMGEFRPYRYVLDWEYALRVAIRKPQAFVFLPDEPLLDYRLHGANTILFGEIRNHLEAGHMLRSALVRAHGRDLARPLARLHLIDRFLRRKESANRDHALKLQATQAAERISTLTQQNDWYEGQLREHVALVQAEREQVVRLEQARAEAWVEIGALRQRRDAVEAHLADTQVQLAAGRVELDRLAPFEPEVQRLRAREAELATSLAQAEHTVRAMQASSSWRLTAPLRRAMSASRRVPVLHKSLRVARKGAGGLLRQVRALKAAGALEAAAPPMAGAAGEHASGLAAGVSPRCTPAYLQWLGAERAHAAVHAAAVPDLAARPGAPRFSLVVPLFETDPAMLSAMLDSVFAQTWPHWELCLCDDASARTDTAQALATRISARLAEQDSGFEAGKVRLVRHATNTGIVGTSNDALALAGGDWIVLLDHDDTLAPHALAALAQALAREPDARLLYSDEDKLDESGLRCLPYFKPDFSPALLATQNYIGHLLALRADLMQALGGFREGTDGSQDYDLVLRASEATRAIVHVPQVLYHWRLHAGSTAINTDSKPYAHEAGRLALAAHLARRYPDHFERVDDGEHLFTYQPRFKLPARCLASIIIPTKDKADLLEACLRSILTLSTWPDFEVLILDNNSTEPATFEWFERIQREDSRVRVLPAAVPFNWSRLNNLGVRQARGDVFVFLNNDTEVISPDWLEQLMQWARLPDVATVGAQLRYGDGSLQHAGVVVGMGGWADHIFKAEAPAHLPGPFVSNVLTRNVMASTGACVAISRAAFDALGGWDEAFEICGSDVEIGIRAHKRGLQNVYLATVRLYHHESKTRSSFVPEVDFIQSDLKYAPYRLGLDPFFNANLSREHSSPTPRYPESA